MFTWSKVFLGKLLWNIASMKQTLWVQWVHSVRLKGWSIWAYKKKEKDHWYWKKILKVRPIVRPKIQVVVGTGQNVSFWHDSWCEFGAVWEYLDDRERGYIQVPFDARLSEFTEGADLWLWNAAETYVHNKVWGEVRYREVKVGWTRWLWNNHGILRHSFIVWLLFQNMLSTKTDCIGQVWLMILQKLNEYRGAREWSMEKEWEGGVFDNV
ncbi:hypothetical protein LIER_11540 [Lithospermum erythrorhizon]|uniref:Reverse transcriptase zinc-binding domain-containing protein n=1 Tax=Lithospermum erythrorhizon TaxID=34254 RepID=A0AAV3PQ03_LITER